MDFSPLVSESHPRRKWLGRDSETRGEKNPSRMENHTKCISCRAYVIELDKSLHSEHRQTNQHAWKTLHVYRYLCSSFYTPTLPPSPPTLTPSPPPYLTLMFPDHHHDICVTCMLMFMSFACIIPRHISSSEKKHVHVHNHFTIMFSLCAFSFEMNLRTNLPNSTLSKSSTRDVKCCRRVPSK